MNVRAQVPFAGWIERIPAFALIPLVVFVDYLLSIVVMVPFQLVAPDAPLGGPNFHLQGIGFVAALIVACLIAPVFETLVFQWAIIGLARKKLRLGAGWAIVVSAVAFGLAHSGYSAQYAARAAVSGLVLGTVFVVEQDKRGAPFWVVAAIHALHNLIATFLLSQLV